MRPVLDGLIRRFLVVGSLSVRYPDDQVSIHRGKRSGPSVEFHVTDWRAVRRMVLNPALAFGEGYMDCTIIPVGCSIYDALDLLLTNVAAGGRQPVMALHGLMGFAVKRWAQFNPAHRAARNAAHHYDLNGRLYALLLDQDRQYSCAYFPTGQETLDEAQAAKKRHIGAKLGLQPGMHVLDIGCGWGGLALTLARDHGVRVTGITLSQEQLAAARTRAEIISYAVWLYFRFPLSLRMVEEMLAARGLSVTYETVRQWGLKFGREFANRIRRRAPRRGDKWHLDEVVLTIAGKKHCLCSTRVGNGLSA